MREPVDTAELNVVLKLGEFRPWVESLCERYKNPEWNDHFVAKRGLTNRIQGELIPLALLCFHLTTLRSNSYLKYFPGSTQSFDAQMLSADHSVEEVLEVTLACDGYRDSIAGEYLKKHGWAPLWIPLEYSGRKNSREISLPVIRSMSTHQIIEDGLTLVRNAVDTKSVSGKYQNTSLVVGFEDFRLRNIDFEYARNALLGIKSTFQVIYYVGLGGRFFATQRAGA